MIETAPFLCNIFKGGSIQFSVLINLKNNDHFKIIENGIGRHVAKIQHFWNKQQYIIKGHLFPST